MHVCVHVSVCMCVYQRGMRGEGCWTDLLITAVVMGGETQSSKVNSRHVGQEGRRSCGWEGAGEGLCDQGEELRGGTEIHLIHSDFPVVPGF